MSAKEIFDQIVAGNKDGVRDLFNTEMSERTFSLVSDMRQGIRLLPSQAQTQTAEETQ